MGVLEAVLKTCLKVNYFDKKLRSKWTKLWIKPNNCHHMLHAVLLTWKQATWEILEIMLKKLKEQIHNTVAKELSTQKIHPTFFIFMLMGKLVLWILWVFNYMSCNFLFLEMGPNPMHIRKWAWNSLWNNICFRVVLIINHHACYTEKMLKSIMMKKIN